MNVHSCPVIKSAPNVSEGRDRSLLQTMCEMVSRHPGAALTDWSADTDHNRAVFTLIGAPAAVVAALKDLAAVAVDNIDLRRHSGNHPRIGALDVVPLIPVRGMTLADCVEISHQLGQELAAAFGIPVYLYAASATRSERERLEFVRRGGIERLQERITAENHLPDYGPPTVHPTAGAICVGARGPLVAYNVNLDTDDVSIARAIAHQLRERDGGLPGVKALGLLLESRQVAQVSFNITRPDEVSLYTIFAAVRDEAARHGVRVLESELIGTLSAADACYALRDALMTTTVTPERIDDIVVERLSECDS